MAIIDIVNVALRSVGEQSLTVIDDTTPHGKIVDDVYLYVRDEVFRAHAWNFALRRGGLAGFHHPGPEFEFARSYLLPSGKGNYGEAIRVIDIDQSKSRYKVEKGHILSDVNGTMTNALSDSKDFTTANWTATGTGTRTANAATGPDNALDADLISDTDAAARYFVSQAITVTNDEKYHFAGVKIKANTATSATLQLKLTGGTTTITAYNELTFSGVTLIRGGTGGIHSYDVEALDNSYYWLWLCIKNNGTGNTTLTVEIHPTGLATDTVSTVTSIWAVDAWCESITPLDARWIEIVTDTDLWTKDFITVYAKALAKALAIPIANSRTLAQVLDGEYKDALRRARSIDAIEDFPDEFPESSWTSSRRGSLT